MQVQHNNTSSKKKKSARKKCDGGTNERGAIRTCKARAAAVLEEEDGCDASEGFDGDGDG